MTQFLNTKLGAPASTNEKSIFKYRQAVKCKLKVSKKTCFKISEISTCQITKEKNIFMKLEVVCF